MLLDIVFSVQIVGRKPLGLGEFDDFCGRHDSLTLTVESGFEDSGDQAGRIADYPDGRTGVL
jgi:hypothetical protein